MTVEEFKEGRKRFAVCGVLFFVLGIIRLCVDLNWPFSIAYAVVMGTVFLIGAYIHKQNMVFLDDIGGYHNLPIFMNNLDEHGKLKKARVIITLEDGADGKIITTAKYIPTVNSQFGITPAQDFALGFMAGMDMSEGDK